MIIEKKVVVDLDGSTTYVKNIKASDDPFCEAGMHH